jgi:hypothetical protein
MYDRAVHLDQAQEDSYENWTTPVLAVIGRLNFRTSIALAALVASLAVALLTADSSGAATNAQVRRQLRAWHLRQAPLFPSRLPARFRAAKVTLGRGSFDFNVTWSRDRGHVNVFLVSFRRGNRALLTTVLHDKRTTSVRRVRIGHRRVYSIETSTAAAPSMLAWRDHGRTYLLQEKYVGRRAALRTLSPLVRSLHRLR